MRTASELQQEARSHRGDFANPNMSQFGIDTHEMTGETDGPYIPDEYRPYQPWRKLVMGSGIEPEQTIIYAPSSLDRQREKMRSYFVTDDSKGSVDAVNAAISEARRLLKIEYFDLGHKTDQTEGQNYYLGHPIITSGQLGEIATRNLNGFGLYD